MKGWHWIRADHTLRTGEVVVPNGIYRAVGPLKMCKNGVHASRRALDALQYAPGPVVCAVELSGEIQHDTDKSVARERRVVWMADATNVLHEFACTVATDALALVEARGMTVDPRSRAAIEAKRGWLRGLTTDADLGTARDAAEGAVRGAARDAVRGAARDGAWAAAEAAAWDAVRDATEGAARAAAWNAAWGAARAAAWGPPGDAARERRARDAAWTLQNIVLETMLETVRRSLAALEERPTVAGELADAE